MVRKIFATLHVVLFMFALANAQSIGNYTAVRTTGITYSSISGTGTAFPGWRNTGANAQDDNRSNAVTIGFDFWYDGVRYTQLSASTNGFLDFSSSAANGTTTGPYGSSNAAFTTSGSGTWLALAPFYENQETQGGTAALGNSIKYQLSGSAPSRIFTVEWIGMAVSGNTTPSLNYQVKLYETSGKIEFIYGTMTAGTASYVYSVGINGSTISAAPTAAQLKMQQSANGNVFNNTVQNNLNIIPAGNSKITWTPPVPLNPGSALSFTAVTSSSMTLNWTNWASNNVGYAIYNSTDGINYSFVSQTATNAISSNQTGLLPGTLYYWKVYAVTEGAVSNAISGSRSTSAAGTKIAIVSGNWSSSIIWLPPGVPTAGDNVIISNGVTVVLDQNGACNSLTVGQGTSGKLTLGNSNVARTLDVGTNVTVSNGGTMSVKSPSNATHLLTLGGNIVNNGTLNFAATANALCDVTFTKNGNASISGTGGTNKFDLITLSMGNSINNTLDVTSTAFAAPANFLKLNTGTFKVSTTGAINITPFNAATTIGAECGLTVNSSSAIVNTTGGVITLSGNLTVTNGTLNIGNASNDDLLSSGGALTITGGTVKIAGKYYSPGINDLINFSISGGTLTLPTVGSTSTTIAPFQVSGSGSSFAMSGGSIIIERAGGTGQHLGFVNTGATTGSVTGGTLQIGDASTPAAQIIDINSSYPIGNLKVNSANATATVLTNPLDVISNIDITLGTLNSNNLNISLGGNWTDAGTFTPGTATVTFNGTSAQTLTKATGETFNTLVFTGAGTKTLGSPITANSSLTIASGSTLDVSTNGYQITLKGNWLNNGTFLSQNGTVVLGGTTAQSLGGTSITDFRNITLNNAAGASLATSQNLHGTLTLTTGNFTTTGKTFTLISDATGTARIGQITGGTLTGNITMQRYLPVGSTGWYFLGAPISSALTLANWNTSFIMSGFPGSNYPTYGFVNIYTYNEPYPGIKDSGYVPATNITNPITFKKGYWCYIGPTSPITVSVSGTPGMMNQSFPVTYTPSSGGPTNDGWNMIANPYPSSIDWDAVAWTKTNVSGQIDIWNPNTSTYASYVSGIGVNGGSNVIPSSQAFWIQTFGASPVLSITEACKSAVDQPFMRQANFIQPNVLRLHITGNGYTDETAIRFMAGASTHYDNQLDAVKFFSSNPAVPSLSTLMDSTDASINSLPPLLTGQVIPLRALVGATGTYTINRDTSWTLPQSSCVILEDLLTGTLTDLTTTLSYTFTIADTTHAPRFLIHIGAGIGKHTIATTCPTSANGSAIATGIGNGPFTYTWMNSANTILQVHNNVNGSDTLHGLASGIYNVVINGNTGYCTNLPDTFVVTSPTITTAFTTITNVSCPNSADGMISIDAVLGGTSPYAYSWSNNSTASVLSGLNPGTYTLTVTDAHQCVQNTVLTVGQNSPLHAAFTLNSDTLYLNAGGILHCTSTSVQASSYLWNFGDQATSSLSNPVHQYLAPGLYHVSLMASDGTCSDSAGHNVLVLASPAGIASLNQVARTVQIVSDNGNWYVDFNLPAEANARIRMVDALGENVSADIETKAWHTRVLLPVNQLARGIYFITVQTGDQTISRKLIL